MSHSLGRRRVLRSIAALTIGALASIGAAGCSAAQPQNDGGSATKGTVSWWGWVPEKAVAPQYIKAFNEEYPDIKVDYKLLTIDGYSSALRPALASSVGPDVFDGHSEYGYYNGRTPADFTGKPGARNGVEHWARRGIVGRGVLLDAERWFAAQGDPLDPAATRDITPDHLRRICEAQGTELQLGDILIVRTGWIGWYETLDAERRAEVARVAVAQTMEGPGLEASEDMARFLWDTHVAGAATDTSTFEAWPHRFVPGEYLHMDVLALLGIPIGEMWYLEQLAADCAADGVYEFLFTSAPLHKVGGIASPPNALAIK
jgi:hypothetical protein